ncbi:UDP-glucose dehydrogenase family protein [Longimicrobium terrae]|uniref:UDP-glucose 6-dehydrogenase n=1 Tax=Longimicrobium terrae TaxID=1639882 RepID=A0A841GMT9_9BACT|nr:UDP-glucose/GDP-mannose dehydrogenase family protein [Longimicrobium terrae]MBB4634488.1 UDPglucose 6-dehydrogenase [Longimicrobium terrae]MBB6068622.1 UDPglucose 6-dehydrogenase [Longimicrobium terrae]NNC27808.1 UDP-glucose/GDP-mannose dehydrogenase family protein [Longimicrobium terrae]
MRIAVVGTGYVGLVVGACLAETGNDVVCADVDAGKIARLNAGEIPIYEPGLEPLVERNLRDGRISFTTDVGPAVASAEIIFIAVGTPPGEDGSADLKHVLAVADTIGSNMPDDGPEKIVITKSTVPVGTAAKVRAAVARHTGRTVHVCSNPEFLKEGAAVLDFMKPDRVVVGVDSEYAREKLGELYAPFVRTGNPILFMDIASAEITKYAANAMLATRISFMNMIAGLCEAVGADVTHVRQGIGTDERIGPGFLFAGIGYGGSCFPKDVKALIHTLRDTGVDASILDGVEQVNDAQKSVLVQRVTERFGADLTGRTFGVWGLSFKPETDDMREAPSLTVVRGLVERGARVRAHDPEAGHEAERYFEDLITSGGLTLCEHNYDCLEGADALLVLTEWAPYRNPDFARVRAQLGEPVIFDGRNLWDPERMREAGFHYVSIGRQARAGSARLAATA